MNSSKPKRAAKGQKCNPKMTESQSPKREMRPRSLTPRQGPVTKKYRFKPEGRKTP